MLHSFTALNTKNFLKHSAYFASLKIALFSLIAPLFMVANRLSDATAIIQSSNIIISTLIGSLVWGLFRALQIQYASIEKSPTPLIAFLFILSSTTLTLSAAMPTTRQSQVIQQEQKASQLTRISNTHKKPLY